MATTSDSPRFVLLHVLRPLLVFALGAALLEGSNLDLWLADWIYQEAGGGWSLRDYWLTRDLIHEGGRVLVAAMIFVLVMLLAGSQFFSALRKFRRDLWFLLVSSLAAGFAINLLKEISHIDCPWDLLRYGGEQAYVRNFAAHPDTFPYGACFPAGHASAGYAWFGLYYLAREYRAGWQWAALAGVLVMGLVFGVGQQLRGAHFLSHDWWTLGISWLITTTCYCVFYPGRDHRSQ